MSDLAIINLLAQHHLALVLSCLLLGLLIGSFLSMLSYRLPLMLKRDWQQQAEEILLEAGYPLEPAPESPSPPSSDSSEKPGQTKTAGQQPKTEGTPASKQLKTADVGAVAAEKTANTDPSAPFNLAFPASHCPDCQTPIKLWQNIPVLGYVLLRGRCGHCQTPISLQYPLTELFCGLFSAYLAWHLGWSWQLAAGLLLFYCLVPLTLIDLKHQLLPDNLTQPLIWAGLIINTQGIFAPLESAFWGAVAGYLSLWSFYWLFKLSTGKEGMGYGDFKLFAALGAWFGWPALLPMLIYSSFLGLLIGGVFLRLTGQSRQVPIAFGPFIAVAGLIELLWGEMIRSSYLQWSGF